MQVSRVANFINNSPKTQKFLKSLNQNPALYGAGISFVCASLLRPTAIMALPMNDKKDKAYTVGSSVATGVSELIFASLLFIPTTKLLTKTSKNLYKAKGTIYEGNNLMLRDFKSRSNRLFKTLTLPIAAFVRFALISPIVKFLFKKDKSVVGGCKK